MYHVDLKLLRSFAAVAAESSVTRAAERLHLTQPTVSGQLKELELELGFSLFHRTTRNITLTPQGEQMLPLVQSLMLRAEDVRDMAETIRRDRQKRFRLGAALYSLDFADRTELIDAFSAARPDIRLAINSRLQSDQVRDLLMGKLDAALLLGLPVTMGAQDFLGDFQEGEIVNEVLFPASLDHIRLRRRAIGLLVPEGSELARHEVIPQELLAGHRVAMLSTEHGEAFINPLANFLLSHGAAPMASAEGNALAVERYACRNAICAISIGWFPPMPGMVRRRVEGMNFHLDLSLVLGMAPNPAAQRFFEFARQWQAARDAIDSGIGVNDMSDPVPDVGVHAQPMGS